MSGNCRKVGIGGFWLVMGLIFGFFYNWLVAWMERVHVNRPYTSLQVAFGTGITLLLSVPLIGFQAVVRVLMMFVATGSPMIAGHIVRFIHEEVRDGSLDVQSAAA